LRVSIAELPQLPAHWNTGRYTRAALGITPAANDLILTKEQVKKCILKDDR